MHLKFLKGEVIASSLLALLVSLAGCSQKETLIEHGDLVIKLDQNMRGVVASATQGATPLMNEPIASEWLATKDFEVRDFSITKSTVKNINDSVGTGKEWTIEGSDNGHSLTKILRIKAYDNFTDFALIQVSYVNNSSESIEVVKWVNGNYKIKPQNDTPLFWSFQGSSTSARKDWLLPLELGFTQKNYMGLNSTDYGGGIPVTDIWRSDQGIAIGHVERAPKMVSLPVELHQNDSTAEISIEFTYNEPFTLSPADTLKTFETFVTIHKGDYYSAMQKYSNLLQARGLKFAEPEESAYESSWCAWGYGRSFTIEEVMKTLPKVKKLGIKWVTIDDGFQQSLGDWNVDPKKFPKGDDQMRGLVDQIHSAGMKAMLWWAPLAIHPASKLLKDNPDLPLLNNDSSPRDITWWDAYYLSPVYGKTIDHTNEVVDLFINKWDFDGLKMDGQHLNAAPADYNPEHKLNSPEDSYENMPSFFKTIYTKATGLKKNAVMQICPCGTCMSIYNMPYTNQTVASDPLSSWQVRLKGKTYKAIMGKGAYFGDHVELSDNKNDFASSFGVGAVIGTKFTWPKDSPLSKEVNLLTPDRETIWKKWFTLYDEKMLSKGDYLGGLYDIGYNLPEAHVISKEDTLHYAFYNKQWDGVVELRGLGAGKYTVRDYENDIDLGTVEGPEAQLKTTFKGHLLLEVFPAAGQD